MITKACSVNECGAAKETFQQCYTPLKCPGRVLGSSGTSKYILATRENTQNPLRIQDLNGVNIYPFFFLTKSIVPTGLLSINMHL